MGYCDEWSDDPIKCNNESFRKPMPWIGIYIAAASAICSFAMAVDAVLGLRSRKLWFPCKFFTLNAASLTLLAIAVKLPMDLNSPMPGSFDQFSKLSSVIFMATSMANFMPSLGVMGSKGVLMNMTALGILVITLLVNVCIQLGTGLIFSFTCEHVLVICFTFILFWMMSCSALVVPTTKKILERKYHEISEMICAESVEGGGVEIEILKEDVRKYWLMAESSNPQFVMVRSPTCFASSAISCLSAIVLCEAFVRSFFFDRFSGNVNFFMGKRSSSDYQATTSVIVFIQSASVVLGTLAPLFRCFIAIKINISGGGESLIPEKYWTERQMEWIERPLPLQIGGGRYFKKAINKSKDMALCFCIKVQIVTVVACKIVQLFCLAFVKPLLSCFLEHELNCSQDRGVGCYVLHLEGEDQLPQVMAKNNNVLSRFIQNGINQQPQHLVKLLLQKMTDNFFGVAKFDSTQVHSLNSQEPPNCWKLPIVTLTTIAIALPHNSSCVKEVENLVCSVSQGLKYASIIDEVLGTGGALKKVRDAADVAWSEVSLSGRFLNKDLTEMARDKANTSREILAKLCEIARDYVKESGSLANDCSHWPNKVIAANSMYRITQSLLLELTSYNELSTEELFGHISVMIADILGACLTNLSKAITTKCSTVSIDKRGETVQHMARVIGETEEILKMLQKHQLPSLAPKQRSDIDEWRHLLAC
nr:ATP-dependent RNA helicase [Ipomoea batatas]GME17453.1 ATP-dependent RNA helicase [Ipomoea batatas]